MLSTPDRSSPARLVAVIPAHDEETTVAEVVRRTLEHVDHVVLVDDGSTDGTAGLAEGEGAEVLRLSPNRGKGEALRVGLRHALDAGAETVITLDADGEHEPDDIPALLAALEDADVALGARAIYRSGMRRVLNGLALFWFRLLSPEIKDTICGLRAFRAGSLPTLEAASGGFAYEHEVLLRAVRAGLRMKAVPVRTTPRTRSHVSTAEIVRTNNHFDRWVLRNLLRLPVPVWRRCLLALGCTAGLVLGQPVEWILARRDGRRPDALAGEQKELLP
jgi:glycosyltransferase involved in cell wall biosynthesis